MLQRLWRACHAERFVARCALKDQPRVTTLRVGGKVFGYIEDPFGAHAECLSIPEVGSLATMPASVTHEEVASST